MQNLTKVQEIMIGETSMVDVVEDIKAKSKDQIAMSEKHPKLPYPANVNID